MFHKMGDTAEKASLLGPTKFKSKCDELQQPAGSQEEGSIFQGWGWSAQSGAGSCEGVEIATLRTPREYVLDYGSIV